MGAASKSERKGKNSSVFLESVPSNAAGAKDPPPGLEPGTTGPKPVVLPLHQGGNCRRISIPRRSYRDIRQCPCALQDKTGKEFGIDCPNRLMRSTLDGDRDSDQVSDGANFELAHHVCAMFLNRFFAPSQFSGDHLVRFAGHDHFHHFSLPSGK